MTFNLELCTGERPFLGQICSKGFTCSKRLKVHSRTHTNERPYPCEKCGKTFAYKHVLKNHEMSHLSERLYICKMCPAETFKSKKAQDQHLKLHIATATKQSVMAAATGSYDSSCIVNVSSSPLVNGTSSDVDSPCVVVQESPPGQPPPSKSHCFRNGGCNASIDDSSDHSTTSSSSSSSLSFIPLEVNEIQAQQSVVAIEYHVPVIQCVPRIVLVEF